jgi:ligand-binding sensor domain-containing protein
MIRILFLLFPVLLISQATLIAQPGTWRSYLTPSRINDYMEYAGEVWVATDAGIFTLNPATGAVTGHLTKAAGGLPSNEIEAMAIHPQTMQPFIGTYDVAMAQLNTDGEWHSIEYPQFIVDQAQGDKVMTYCLQFDGQGRLWAGTSVGPVAVRQ